MFYKNKQPKLLVFVIYRKWFFTTFQELLFGVPASPQPLRKRGRNTEGEKYKGKNLVLWYTERNYRVINSFVFLKIGEEPRKYYN
jgi:hypothetical protein